MPKKLRLRLLLATAWLVSCSQPQRPPIVRGGSVELEDNRSRSSPQPMDVALRSPVRTPVIDSKLYDFSLPTPQSTSTPSRCRNIWGTYYFLPQLTVSTGKPYPLRDMNERPLTQGGLSKVEWCKAATQGSVRIRKLDGTTTLFTHGGKSDRNFIDCSGTPYAGVSTKIRGNRFAPSNTPYGKGSYAQVIPFRSLAVDPNYIDYGSVIYIPQARGKRITLDDGTSFTHDGYFFAADTGSAIKGCHVDYFSGELDKAPFSFVASRADVTVSMQIVNDQSIVQQVRKIHGL